MKGFAFKFELPVDTWTDQTVYLFKGPREDNLDHFLMLTIDRVLQEEGLEAYAKEKTDRITEAMTKLTIMKNRPVVLGEWLDAHELIIKWVIGPKLIRYKRFVFAILDQQGFCFCCDFTEASYSLLVREMNAIIASLLTVGGDPSKRRW